MNNTDYITCCGVKCAGCPKYPAECKGCNAVEGRVFWVPYIEKEVCPFYQCCVNEHGYTTCAQCDNLPCELFSTIVDPSSTQEQRELEFRERMRVLETVRETASMKAEVETLPPSRIAFMRRTGAYGAENQQLMETFKCWASEQGLLDDESVILGVTWDNPDLTPPESCRYDTCLVVPEKAEIDGESVLISHIFGGKYAVFLIEHTAQAVQKAWLEMFAALSEQSLAFDPSRPVIERYKSAFVRNHQCELCVPIL